MRIAIVVHSLNEGYSKAIYHITKYLKDSGDQPYVFVLFPTSPDSFVYKLFLKDNLQNFIVDIFSSSSIFNFKVPRQSFITINESLAIAFKNMKRLSSLLIKYNIDVALLETNFVPAKPFIDTQIPYVLHFHEPMEKFPAKFLKIFKDKIIAHQLLLMKSAKEVILSSGFYLNYIKGVGINNYKIIYHGCLVGKMINNERVRITFLKRFDSSHFSEISGIINSMPNYKFTVIGSFASEKDKNNFLKLIESNNFDIFTNVSEELMYKLLDESLFHIGTYVENFGVYSIEGACRGSIPVLPSGIGSLEIFKNMESCIEYPVGDIAKLKNQLESIINNNGLLCKLRINAYNIASQYNWKNYAREIRDTLIEYSRKS